MNPAFHGLQLVERDISVGVAPGVVQVEGLGPRVVGGDGVGVTVDNTGDRAIHKAHGQHFAGVDEVNQFSPGHVRGVLGGGVVARDLVDDLIHPTVRNACVAVGAVLANPTGFVELGVSFFSQSYPEFVVSFVVGSPPQPA